MADGQEHVEPGRHEREVDRAAGEHEGAGDERHAPRSRNRTSSESRNSSTHIAQGLKPSIRPSASVNSGSPSRDALSVPNAASRPARRRRRSRRSGRERRSRPGVPPSKPTITRPSITNVGTPGGQTPARPRQREQRFARGRVPVDGTVDDRDGPSRAKRPEERLGVGAVRTAVAHEDLERARRRGCRRTVVRSMHRGRHGRRAERQQGGERCEGASRGARRERPPGREERVFGHRSKGALAPVRIASR